MANVLRKIDTAKYAGGGFLSDPEGLVQDLNDLIETMFLESLGDDQPPRLTWVSTSSIRVDPPPGSPTLVRLTLQDGSQRTFDGSLSVGLPANLDTGSEAADTWYYVYAVPDPTDDKKLVGVLSASTPSVGPAGNTSSFKYLGAIRNDAGSDVVRFQHTASGSFRYDTLRLVQSLGSGSIATEGSPVAVALANFVPDTAEEASVIVRLAAQAAATGMVKVFVDGSEAQPQLDYVQAVNGAVSHQPISVPTPTSPKRMFRQLQETSGQLDTYVLEMFGWVDGFLG